MISWIRIESILVCWFTHFFLRHKFSDRKIVHGVRVTKSVAKHRDGTESPLVISGWIFFIVPEENMFQLVLLKTGMSFFFFGF
jgi:hypothetical protein